MSYVDEMKSLVGEIRSSRYERKSFVKAIEEEVGGLLRGFNKELEDLKKEIKEKKKELDDFLAKSENTRMVDFRGIMKGIGESIKDIEGKVEQIKLRAQDLLKDFDKELKILRQDLEEFLTKSETERKIDLRETMKNIRERIEGVGERVKEIFHETRGLLGEYKEERKKAAGYWAALTGKKAEEFAPVAAKPKTEKPKAKPRREKRKKKK